MQNAIRMRELENDNKNLLNEKNKYEVEYKVLSERYHEIKSKYDLDVRELEYLKTRQNEVMVIIIIGIR